MKAQPQLGSTCTVCEIGTLAVGENSFIYDCGNRSMWIEHTPALVCTACNETTYDATLSAELIKASNDIFAKSSGLIYIYQFSDFVRPDVGGPDFKANDRVRIKDDVNTWDMYDEDLQPGMEGLILCRGVNKFDWQVAFFLPGKHLLEIDIDQDDLELAEPVKSAVKTKKPRTRKTPTGK